MMGTKTLSLFSIFLFQFAAFASPIRPTGGAIEVRLEVSPNQINQIEQGTLPKGQPIYMTLSFLYPKVANATGAQATVIFDPMDSTIAASSGNLMQSQIDTSDSSYDAPQAFRVALANVTPGTRVSASFLWTPTGNIGASARTTVIFSNSEGKQKGQATYTVGVVGQNVRAMNSTQLYKLQLSQMKQDVTKTAEVLVSRPEHTVPFIPQNHSESLSRDSDEFKDEDYE